MPQHNSDALDDPILFVRQESFGGGLSSYQRPNSISETQFADALNVFVDQNLRASTRPGVDSLGDAAPGGSAALVQALGYYDTPTHEQLLLCAGNSFYKWDGANWSASLAGYTATAESRPNMAQGINEMLIVDGTQNVYAWDGSAFTDLGTGTGKPPTGASMVEWHTYRAFYSGISTEPDALYISDIADPGTVQEASWVTRIGEGEGEKITGIHTMQGSWLAVFKENSIWMIDAQPTATSAAAWSYTKVTGGIGCVGPRAAVRYGTDLFFLSREGIRTLQRMAAVGGQYEITPPLSQPVQDIIDRINWSYAHRVAAGRFDQFVFFSLPLDSATEPSHTLVWNGRLGVWLGLWDWAASQFEITRFADELQLAFGHASDGTAKAWKFDDDRALEATFQDDSAAISTSILTRSWDFGDLISQKETWKAELRFIESAATCAIELVLDGETVKSWSTETVAEQNALPVDLPFDLATTKPLSWKRGLGKKKFNELQLRLSSTSDRLSIESISLSAFMDNYR